ncbi:MAG TPA: hypothetical protein VKB26_12750 [Candidatus Acidoferrales bacterium]|nr:hypothetical protein [Candidatus Acidoferrales bacterium]
MYTAPVKDISDVFDHYRVSARAIWNTAFWPDVSLRDWDSVDQFDEIQRILFTELVLRKTEREWPMQDVFQKAIPFFRIVPTCDAPIMINNPRSPRETGYWDDPVNRVKPGESELQFIAYFDWNQMDYVDLRYYRVKICRFDGHSEVVGREALIDRDHTAVQLTE